MLVRHWITERIGAGTVNYERLAGALLARAEAAGLDISAQEIRVVLEKLIADGVVEPCQFLAEEQCYRPTVYDNSNIYWYWFRLPVATAAAGAGGQA